MRTTFFVVFNRHGFVSAYKTDRFSLKQGEYATEIVLEVPEDAFAPLSLPKVQVTLPTEALRRTFEATVVEEQQ
jgi:hypothetical protein